MVGRKLREKMVVDGVEEVFGLVQGLWWSAFCCACVVGQYVDNDDVIFSVSCLFDFVKCLLQFVCCVFLNVVFCGLFVCFFVNEVKCVLNVVFVKEFVVCV